MNRSKKIYILLGILAAVCLLTFIVSRYEQKKEKIKNSDEIILKIDSEDVTSLSWKNETAELAFHKDDTWIYDEDEAFPVSEEKVTDLLEQFKEFGASFIIEDVEDYGQYGLDKPLCTINIETKDKAYEIKLGDYSTMDSQRYVSIGDGKVYLVKEDPLESFELELKDLIDNDEIPNLSETTGMEFQGSEDYKIVYEEDSKNTYCDEDVYFMKKKDDLLPLDTGNVEAYLDTVTNLSFDEYVTYNATEEELAKYGLKEPKLSMTMKYMEGEEDEKKEKEFVLHISRDPKEKDEKNDSEDEEITAYARVGESKIIYKISGEDYKAFMKASYNDLRHQEVLSADFADINKIDISLEGKDYTLTSKEEDDETVWYYGEKKVEADDLDSALSSLDVSEFTDEEPSQKEEISLKVYLDNENYPEVDIELYRYDGSKCLAVLDGEPLALLDRSHVVELVEAVNAIVLN